MLECPCSMYKNRHCCSGTALRGKLLRSRKQHGFALLHDGVPHTEVMSHSHGTQHESPIPSRRGSAASHRRPSGGLGSRLEQLKLTSMPDAKDHHHDVAVVDEPATYRKGSASVRRESHGPHSPGTGSNRLSFARCVQQHFYLILRLLIDSFQDH